MIRPDASPVSAVVVDDGIADRADEVLVGEPMAVDERVVPEHDDGVSRAVHSPLERPALGRLVGPSEESLDRLPARSSHSASPGRTTRRVVQ